MGGKLTCTSEGVLSLALDPDRVMK
jgi:hypothetical protein